MKLNLLNLQVFIAHYPPLTKRKTYLEKALGKLGYDRVYFNEKFDYKEIDDKHYQLCTTSTYRYVTSEGWLCGIEPMEFNICRNPRYLANFFNHTDIWYKVANGDDEYALVLEDDAVVTDDCKEILEKLSNDVPDDLDLAYLHAGCGLTCESIGIVTDDNEYWYKINNCRSRTCCSYLLSKTAARKMLTQLFPIALPVDWEMIYIAGRHNLNVYWSSLLPFEEGSQSGVHNSTFR